MNKKISLEFTNTENDTKNYKFLGIGFRELKFFIILWRIIKCSIKNRINPVVLSRLNPKFKNGGKVHLSKMDNYNYFTENNNIAKKYFAKCIAIPSNEPLATIKKRLMQFKDQPIVLKPDQGARSIGIIVTKPDSKEITILDARKNMDYIAQEYVSYPHELGVYYYRYPDWKRGKILGIAEKKFDIIIGDGISSLKKLLEKINITDSIQMQMIQKYKTIKYVPKRGEKILLANTIDYNDEGEYYNRNDIITPELEKKINSILKNKEINFCRFDIRTKSIQDAACGKNFKILEINIGPAAVLLHAFDPRYSKREQLKICFEGYEHAFKIARKLKPRPKERLISYIWFLIKDEVPLFFLRKRIEKMKKELK